MFFFFAGPFIPALYTGAHLLAARKVPLFLRVSGVLLLLAISQIYPINITLFKNLSGPDMPAWLLKAQTALFAALVMLFLFLLARDVLSLAAFLGRVLFRKKAAAAPPESPSRRNFLRGGLAAAFSMGTPAVSLAGGAVGVSAGTAYPGLHFTDAFLPSLPPELEGLKIPRPPAVPVQVRLRVPNNIKRLQNHFCSRFFLAAVFYNSFTTFSLPTFPPVPSCAATQMGSRRQVEQTFFHQRP